MGLKRNTKILVGATALMTLGSGIAHYTGAPSLVVFALCAIALCGVAWEVTEATDALGAFVSVGLATLIQSTAGNAAELGISINALRLHDVKVVEASLLGSIMANALPVLTRRLRVAGHQLSGARRGPTPQRDRALRPSSGGAGRRGRL